MSKALLADVLVRLADEVPSYLCRNLQGAEYSKCHTRLKKFFNYTTVGGKMARPCLVYDTYTALRPDASQAELHSASQVAATLEMLNSFFLTVDDIMDNAEIRRAKSSYWRLPGIGTGAMNDALLLDNSIDWVVRRAIPQHPKLYAILQSFWEIRQNTHLGQLLDCGGSRIEEITWTRYYQIIGNKTSDHSYYLPLVLGYQLADIPFDDRIAHDIGNKMGCILQAQNDVVECYSSPEELGKSCNDLAEGKCTWVSCRVLEKLSADKPMRDAFLRHFGRTEQEHRDGARAIVRALGIKEDYERFRDDLAARLWTDIQAWRDATPKLRAMLYATIERTKIWPNWKIEEEEGNMVENVPQSATA